MVLFEDHLPVGSGVSQRRLVSFLPQRSYNYFLNRFVTPPNSLRFRFGRSFHIPTIDRSKA